MNSTSATPNGVARDHGGNLMQAMAAFGGAAQDWLDLSTGINPYAYPLPHIPPRAFSALPDAGRLAVLIETARRAYRAPNAGILAAPGAQALIEALPAHLPRHPVSIASPTYNEHAAAFRAHGFDVVETTDPCGPVRLIVNPNNPDGRIWSRAQILDWLHSGATVIVDESFADPDPAHSVADLAGRPGLIVLRSFGKFFGLAGLRLGFILGAPALIAALRPALGLWSVSGPAIEVGIAALADTAWQADMRRDLPGHSLALQTDLLATGATLVGATPLFVTIRHKRAAALHTYLARQHIWTRIFPYAPDWVRLGLPGTDATRLRAALATF